MEIAIRLRHTYASNAQLVERINLGVLPGYFLLLAPVLASPADRTRLATASYLATFLILHALLEAALCHVLVNLCAAYFVAAADNVYRRLFAALEWAQHFINDAVIDQRLQALGDLHGVSGGPLAP